MSGPAPRDLNGGAGPAPRYAPVSGIEWIGLLLAIGAVLAPFCFVTYPPLHDYPFHLARIQILHSLGSGDYFDRIYSFNSWLLPNVAMDAALLGLLRFVDDVRLAGLLFVAAVQVLTVGGVAFLRWTLQRQLGVAPLLAAIVAHNWIFLFGFVNYLFGLALFLWCFALWIRQMDGPILPRLLVGALAAAMLFFCHFLAFCVFALAVAALERYFSVEERIPADHPLRRVKAQADAVLGSMGAEFDAMYASGGRPSIAPELLLKATLLIALYSVRSDRLFCEMLDYNMLLASEPDRGRRASPARAEHQCYQTSRRRSGAEAAVGLRPGRIRRNVLTGVMRADMNPT